MKQLYTILFFAVLSSTAAAQTASFDWETVERTLSQTVNNNEVSYSTDGGFPFVFDNNGFGGSTARALIMSISAPKAASVTFTFSGPVDIESIFSFDYNQNAAAPVWTFTPMGGNNTPVVRSIPDLTESEFPNGIIVPLNWTGVTSFTVTSNNNTDYFAFDDLVLANSTTAFDWETAGSAVDQTVSGVTVRVTDDGKSIFFGNAGGFAGSTGQVIGTDIANGGTSVTFTFSAAVDLESIFAVDNNASDDDPIWTFTPTGGNNTPVVQSIPDRNETDSPNGITVPLNWTGVTSFTVTSNNNPDGFLFDNLIVSSALPVDWLSFNARSNGKAAELNWTVADEVDHDHYEVEWSADGRAFTALGRVTESTGEEQASVTYSYVHQTPGSGTNYYRIRQVDIDGAFSYSVVRHLAFAGAEDKFRLFPNPASDRVTIATASTDQDREVRIYSTTGRLMRKQTMAAGQSRLTVPTASLPAGTYLARVGNHVQPFVRR